MRKEHETTPVIQDGRLYTEDDYTGLQVGSAAWFVWLALGRTFYLSEPGVTYRCEALRSSLPIFRYSE